MIDETKLEKIKTLILQREQIDRELEVLLGDATTVRRGRPRSKTTTSINDAALPDNNL